MIKLNNDSIKELIRQVSQANLNNIKYLQVKLHLNNNKGKLRKHKEIIFDFDKDEARYGHEVSDRMALFVSDKLEKDGYYTDLIQKQIKSGYTMRLRVYLYERKENLDNEN